MKIAELINEYQKRVDEIRFDMPAHEKMGGGQYYRHKLGMYEEFLRKLREVEVPDWIPITERLPEECEIVLVTCKPKKGSPNINRAYYSNGFWHGSGSMSSVIAWQPMPEVYEEGVSG